MKRGTPMSNHLDEFNKIIKIIMDLKNIDIKLDEELQILILLCLLPVLFDNIENSMFCSRGQN